MSRYLKNLLIVIFLAISLIDLKIVLAEIRVGGISYPPLILIPILVIIAAIIAIIIYLIYHSFTIYRINKSHTKKKQKIKQKEEKPKKIEKKEVKQEEQKEKISVSKKKILKTYLPLVQSLKKGQKKLTLEQAVNKFSLLLRRFFKEFYDLDYEFTFDELEKDLEKKKQKKEIINFVKNLESQYDQYLTREQLGDLIRQFEEILNELTLVEVDKISDILKNEKREFNDVIMDGLRGKSANGSFNERRKKIIELIQKWENAPEEKQKEIFAELYGEFGSMTKAERNAFFKKIYDAYEKHNVQVCPGTISCQSSTTFKKQLDALKNKFEKRVFYMEE